MRAAHQGLGVRGRGQGLGQSVLSWAPRLRWGHWGLDAGARRETAYRSQRAKPLTSHSLSSHGTEHRKDPLDIRGHG